MDYIKFLVLKNHFLFLLVIFGLVTVCPINGQATLTGNNGKNGIVQKQLSPKDYDLWEYLILRNTSNNGEWVSYTMDYVGDKCSLFVKNTKNNIIYEIPKGANGTFAPHNNYFAFFIKGEGFGYINLISGERTNIQGVENFKFSSDGNYLAFLIADNSTQDSKNLYLKELKSGTQTEIKNVSWFDFNGKGNHLVYSGRLGIENVVAIKNLEKINVPIDVITSSKMNTYQHLIWDEKGETFAFLEAFKDDNFKETSHIVHQYRKNKLYSFDHRKSKEFPEHMYVAYGFNTFKLFRKDNFNTILFGISPWTRQMDDENEKKAKKSNVQVWNWKDKEIYPKLKSYQDHQHFISAWCPTTDSFLQLENPEQKLLSTDGTHALTTNHLKYKPSFKDEYFDIYITNFATGEKRPILEKQLNGYGHVVQSPGGKYICYYRDKHWWVYDIRNKTHTNITVNLPYPTYDLEHTMTRYLDPFGLGGWSLDDKEILVYDEFDIWLITPDGKSQKRLTNGRTAQITHRIKWFENSKELPWSFPQFNSPSYNLDGDLIINLYGEKTKKSGYALWRKGNKLRNIVYGDKYIHRIEKTEKNTYLVQEQRFDMPPRLVEYSVNGGLENEIVQSNPQHWDYSWGKAKLIEYPGIKGDTLQGALFYPANYEPGRKYPMVVGIYEKKSKELHHYVNPSLFNEVGFNPTQLTLYDYFILYPDIEYEYNEPGISATKCVTSAVKKVLEMGVVNEKAIGLWGHSFGGYETVFILTQTDMFAAGIAASPPSMDILSSYLGIYHNIESEAEFFENSQLRFTGSFWDFPEAYLNNSPIHNLNKIKTPLLSWHGMKDPRVNISQSIELYNAMRRLGKEHEFLVYPNGVHILNDSFDQADLSNRMMHWFNSKLKQKN